MDIRRSPDAASLAEHAAAYIAGCIGAVMAARDCCHLALAGGNTPEAVYALLARMQFDWQRLHVWFGDERCLPRGAPGRNDAMAKDAWLDHVPIPAANIHAVPAELGPIEGAAAYAKELAAIERLDIALFGMGEDGHTASLFPGNPALDLDAPVVPVSAAPKPPAERISLSLPTLNRARERIFMVSGAGKREALGRVVQGEPLPAARVADAVWFVDAEAYPAPVAG